MDQAYCSNLNSGFQEPQTPPYLGKTAPPMTPLFGNADNMKEIPLFGGNFSRGKYDVGSVEIDTRQSTLPLEYLLDPTYAERCQQCRPAAPGWIAKQGISYDTKKPLIDTESDLRNLNRVLTRDPNYKYLPYCPTCGSCPDGTPCSSGVSPGCEACQTPLFHFRACANRDEYTRTSNPTCTLRETGTNRFQPICLNPQDEMRWLPQGEVGINYRMVVKDLFCPCVPIPLDPSASLPRGGDLPCSSTTPVCANYISPMHAFQIGS